MLRFFGEDGDDRLLLVNLGRDLQRAEPARAAAGAARRDGAGPWSGRARISVTAGAGTPPVETGKGWDLPGHAAVVLAPNPLS